jgi:hypothetical protein
LVYKRFYKAIAEELSRREDELFATEETEVGKETITADEYNTLVDRINETYDEKSQKSNAKLKEKVEKDRQKELQELEDKYDIEDGLIDNRIEELKTSTDRNVNQWATSKVIDLFETFSEDRGDTFEDRLAIIEQDIIPNLGERINDYNITPETVADMFALLNANSESIENFDKDLFNSAKRSAELAIQRYLGRDVLSASKASKQEKINTLRSRGFTVKDINEMTDSGINAIYNTGMSKVDYLESLKPKESLKVQELEDVLNQQDTNIRTEQELNDMISKISLEHGELYDAYPDSVIQFAEEVKIKLASLKGFENLKEGDIVEMTDGSLRKVSKLQKSQVKLVNYNSVIADEIAMKKSEFNKGTKRIVNDFNKGAKGISTTLEQGNIDELSELLRNFTGAAITVSEEVPAEETLREHFKICK